MSFFTTDKTRSTSLSKGLCTGAAASVLLAVMAFAPAAQAQVIDVEDCATFTDGSNANPLDDDQTNNFSNPGVADAGVTVNINVEGDCVIADGEHVLLEDGDQDDVIINVFGDGSQAATTLTSTDGNDEEVVFFIDNGENDTTINIRRGATIQGEDGVIFIEGDSVTVNNRGSIIGTGTQDEGVIYIDRDTDGDANVINNRGVGEIIAEGRGPAIGIELLIADGFDDAADVGVQNDVADLPTVRILNTVNATIASEYNGTSSDDNDAINIAGNPGSTGGLNRVCVETGAVNCLVTLQVNNFGTISSVFDNSGVAAITFEDDAVFNGAIVNRGTGVISGFRNGIRIGDIVGPDGVSTAEHGDQNGDDARIINYGLITGTNTNGRGIDLEGDNVRITNNASGTIIGGQIGIEVGAGSTNTGSSDGIEAENSGLNNVIVNSGTIEGGSQSINSSNAEGIIRIISEGGSFVGDIRGSVGNQDVFVIQNGETILTHDVEQDFDVNVGQTGTLTFDGDRTIEGNLDNRGTITLDISDTQTITGDVNLRATGTVALTDISSVGSLGTQYTLLDVGGTLVNDSALDISDASLLLDFVVVSSSDLVVEAVASGSAKSTLAKVGFTNSASNVFGETVLTAFADGSLNNTSTFSNLGGISTSVGLGDALNSLAPNFNGTLVKSVSNTIQSGAAQIDARLDDLNCNTFYDGRATASFGSEAGESCQTFAESGTWAQSSAPNETQGSLSLSGSTFFNDGFDQDNITLTYGYDHAVSESTVLGLSGSYTESETDDNTFAASSTELDVVQFTAYAGHRAGNAHFVTKASYSSGEADTRRQSFDVIRSEVDIDALNVQSVASYNVNVGQGYYLKPEASLNYNDITTGSFSETGGLNLNVSDASSNVLDGRVGLTFGARKVVSDNTKANMFVTGSVRNDFYGQRDDLGFEFAGQAGSLDVLSEDGFAVQGSAGLNILSGENFSFGGAVSSEFSESENSVGGSVQTKIRW